ncbi:Mu-like prophage major head subunit gpT family protein [Luteibacter aegosomatis]|uniref:Mu-like prophage major head subunit gpT family protein n=1 Tax=Luteibacter aegosomatis TaxID=2911537 RepID=UPI001FF7DCF6|nr:Mu-like prophage major head subunit gpT family protein [Luteibacter aegosomatis]UPG87024.1 Mu-like prophage major head subunit gpT family protein [Luteibacter aegosomatis]
MIVNAGNLKTLFIAFKAAFAGGLGTAPSQYTQIATVVTSTTGAEEYGWLGKFPKMREWIGDRVINGMQSHGYTVKNKPFELTVGVPRNSIEDDQYGVFAPMMTEMGQSAGEFPDELVFNLLAEGRTEKCYDGKPFFATDHPVLNGKGKPVAQSNVDDIADGGPAWYVLDTRRALKPLIFQDRKKPNFVAMVSETDENVFSRAEFVYGVDARGNAGFGFWQQAYSSNKPLNAENLEAAITAMTGRLGDNDRKLGINPSVLVVPSTMEFVASALLKSVLVNGGETNPLAGRLTILLSPWL